MVYRWFCGAFGNPKPRISQSDVHQPTRCLALVVLSSNERTELVRVGEGNPGQRGPQKLYHRFKQHVIPHARCTDKQQSIASTKKNRHRLLALLLRLWRCLDETSCSRSWRIPSHIGEQITLEELRAIVDKYGRWAVERVRQEAKEQKTRLTEATKRYPSHALVRWQTCRTSASSFCACTFSSNIFIVLGPRRAHVQLCLSTTIGSYR